jgi:hypothetical protein
MQLLAPVAVGTAAGKPTPALSTPERPSGSPLCCPDCSFEVTVPSARIGEAPFRGDVFQPFEVGFPGPGNRHYQNFMDCMRKVVGSEARTRAMFGQPLATAVFGDTWRKGGPVNGAWHVNLCDADGDCVVVVRTDRTVTFLDAVDRFGNRLLNMLVDPGALAYAPGHGNPRDAWSNAWGNTGSW